MDGARLRIGARRKRPQADAVVTVGELGFQSRAREIDGAFESVLAIEAERRPGGRARARLHIKDGAAEAGRARAGDAAAVVACDGEVAIEAIVDERLAGVVATGERRAGVEDDP